MMSASWYDSITLPSQQHCWLSRRLMERVNICTRNAAFVHCRGFNCLSYVASTYRNFVKKFSDLLSFLVYVMKECRALVVYLHLFLTSALDGSECWRSRPSSFNAGVESQYPLWLDPRADVGVLKKRKSLAPAGNRIIITLRPARSLVTVPTKLALCRGLTGCLQKSAWSVNFTGLMQSPHTPLIILGSIVSSSLTRAVISLLTGHNTLRSHLHVMGLRNDPACRKCGTEEKNLSAHFVLVWGFNLT